MLVLRWVTASVHYSCYFWLCARARGTETSLGLVFFRVLRGHGGSLVTHSPPNSEIRVEIQTGPHMGKLVVPCRGLAVYSTEPLTSSMYWFPQPFQLPVTI